jgi:hypothetical protein
MVLWGVMALILIPVMVVLRRDAWPARLAAALIAAIAVYGVTNPYVIYHLLHDPSVLRSNLSNTAAMYHVSNPGEALWDALRLICAGTGPAILLAGICGCLASANRRASGLGILLATVSVGATVGFVATAAGKPGEYARFAILPDAGLAIIVVASLGRTRFGSFVALLLAAVTGVYGFSYLTGFARDAWRPQTSSRRVEAADLQQLGDARIAENNLLRAAGKPAPRHPTLGIYADPAPYCLPPVNLYDWTIVRLPRDLDVAHALAEVDVIVRPVDAISWWNPRDTPISWADKQFEVVQRPSSDTKPARLFASGW